MSCNECQGGHTPRPAPAYVNDCRPQSWNDVDAIVDVDAKPNPDDACGNILYRTPDDKLWYKSADGSAMLEVGSDGTEALFDRIGQGLQVVVDSTSGTRSLVVKAGNGLEFASDGSLQVDFGDLPQEILDLPGQVEALETCCETNNAKNEEQDERLTILEGQVDGSQANWNETNEVSPSFIQNKPFQLIGEGLAVVDGILTNTATSTPITITSNPPIGNLKATITVVGADFTSKFIRGYLTNGQGNTLTKETDYSANYYEDNNYTLFGLTATGIDKLQIYKSIGFYDSVTPESNTGLIALVNNNIDVLNDVAISIDNIEFYGENGYEYRIIIRGVDSRSGIYEVSATSTDTDNNTYKRIGTNGVFDPVAFTTTYTINEPNPDNFNLFAVKAKIAVIGFTTGTGSELTVVRDLPYDTGGSAPSCSDEIPENAILSGMDGEVPWYIDEHQVLHFLGCPNEDGTLKSMGEDSNEHNAWSTSAKVGDKAVYHTKIIFEQPVYAPIDCSWLFAAMSCPVLDVRNLNTSKTTDMSCMFYYCRFVETLDLSNFDTRNVTTMSEMFEGMAFIRSLDIHGFDTSSLESADYMFSYSDGLEYVHFGDGFDNPVNKFDLANVTDISAMFQGCPSLKDFWWQSVIAKCKGDLYGLFDGCSSIKSIDLIGYDFTNTDTSDFLSGCFGLRTVSVSDATVLGEKTIQLPMTDEWGAHNYKWYKMGKYDTVTTEELPDGIITQVTETVSYRKVLVQA